jgi:hypothetical protein
MEEQLFFEKFEHFTNARRQARDAREGKFGRENVVGVGIGWKNWPESFRLVAKDFSGFDRLYLPMETRSDPHIWVDSVLRAFHHELHEAIAREDFGRWCVRVLVTQRVAEERVASDVLVATVMRESGYDFLTDVVEVGEIEPAANTSIYRPVTCGVSGGHVINKGGTLGAVVKRKSDGRPLLLSCNHVIANLNKAVRRQDPVIQPSLKDSGNLSNRIGVLSDFVPIDFAGNINYVDAAVAEIDPTVRVLPSMEGASFVPSPSVTPRVGQSVMKVGRTTGLTFGVVTAVQIGLQGVPWPIEYDGKRAKFADIFSVHHSYPPGAPMPQSTSSVAFALDGDSGSLIVERESGANHAVGLLFLVSDQLMEAYGCNFRRVESAMGVEL